MEVNQNSKVTLITIYYNRPQEIANSLQSLLDQTYENLEIIIYDDYSTDETWGKLNEFLKIQQKIADHHNVRLVRSIKNKGFVRSLIDIIDDVGSEYVAIHGSGDLSFPERIHQQAEYLDTHPKVGVVSCWTQVFDSASGKYRDGKPHPQCISTDHLIRDNPIAHGSVMFRLSEYVKVGGYRDFFTFGQDRDLWLRMSLNSEVHVLPKVLYALNKPSHTVSRQLNKKVVQLMLTSFATQLIVMRQKDGHDLIDLYGEKAGLFFNPIAVSTSINKLMLLQFFQNKEDNMSFMMNVSSSINNGLFNRGFLSTIKIAYHTKWLREFIQKILKYRLKNRVLNDHESISGQ